MSKRYLVKISGDLIENEEALDFMRGLRQSHLPGVDQPHIVVIVGGGSEINEMLKVAKYKIEFKDGHRVHENDISRNLAAAVLHDNQSTLEIKLPPTYSVIVPIIISGSVNCHVNADDYLRMLAPNFDEAFCLTQKGRTKDFSGEIKVLEFEEEEKEIQND